MYCSGVDSDCKMSESSILLFPSKWSEQDRNSCKLEKIATSSGWLFGTQLSESIIITKFISKSTRIQFILNFPMSQYGCPVCRINQYEDLYSTSEVLLFSFNLMDGIHPFEKLALTFRPDVNFTNSYLTNIEKLSKSFSGYQLPSQNPYSPVDSMMIIRSRREVDKHYTSKSGSLNELPLELKSQWLLEHQVWDMASTDWNVNELRNATLEFNHQYLLSLCESWRFELMISRAL